MPVPYMQDRNQDYPMIGSLPVMIDNPGHQILAQSAILHLPPAFIFYPFRILVHALDEKEPSVEQAKRCDRWVICDHLFSTCSKALVATAWTKYKRLNTLGFMMILNSESNTSEDSCGCILREAHLFIYLQPPCTSRSLHYFYTLL